MRKDYRHQGFPDDTAFIEHHRAQAAAGNERSIRIVETRGRLEQEELWRQSANRGSAKSFDTDPAGYCAGAFDSAEALQQK